MAYQVQQFKEAWVAILTLEDEPSEALLETVRGSKPPLRVMNTATGNVLIRSRAAKKIKPPRRRYFPPVERRMKLVKPEEISRNDPDPFNVSGPRSILKRKPWIKRRFAAE